ncbi:hypothetical protein [Streptomyces qinglanensis]|uniref:hypothetical protein n=1 Tax=Streptomyces qinglanensis TaxID=943816 RepID=UPI003D731AEC
MATIGYADLPVPTDPDAPTIPAALAEFAEAVDPHLRHTVTDVTERDTLFSDAPQHTLVTADDGTMWLKLVEATNSWATIWEPLPDWRAITLSSGLEPSTIPCQVRREGKRAYTRGRVIKSDASNFYSPTDPVKIGAVPSDCIPAELVSRPASCSLGGDTNDAAGRMEILNTGTSSGNGVPGDILWWYQGTAGTPYIDLPLDYWID